MTATPMTDDSLAAPTEVGALGVCQIKRLWSRAAARRRGQALGDRNDLLLDRLVIHALGLGLEQTTQYLARGDPTFADFERWVVATAGGPDPARAARINALIRGTECPAETRQWLASVEAQEPALSDDDLAFWAEHGYVVLHDAVPPDGAAAAARAVWEHLTADPDQPDSWYRRHDHGIMVQFFQHPAFTANRASPRIHKAFAQLWGTADLWMTTDRCGFNPPERLDWPFPGPDLHWDVSLHPPIPFGTQGILYLTDTPPEQGALTVVPAFHRRVGAWLEGLSPDADPRRQDLHALGSRPIGGRAGDLIIWHHALPHGSRPNHGRRPRLVQYIDMYPACLQVQDVWR
jgi:ectoine hydroxylase-related dioxygenase (phytanoyl-CoA dioxygenase family)